MTYAASDLPAATWRDYLTLTKPKVISLLLFTAVCPMFIAARGLPPWLPLLGVLVGGYMATGGAGVFNMVLDRDIDGKMRRTAKRPLVTGVISVRNAVLFGLMLSAGSFLILWLTANLLTALLAWFGLLFYVLVYTAWLKRSTWQNIVIGGVAGSVMPLLGWAAVTNGLDWMAVLLFMLIFLWTPVHFWALAFLVKEQYAAVGIPMAPAVLGNRRTLQQMLIYAILTILASLTPLVLNEAGWFYTGVVLLLDILLIRKVVILHRQVDDDREVDRQEALSLYKYSMLYLALVFLALVADRSLPFADVDGNTEVRSGTVSVFNGAEPAIVVSDSVEDEIETVAAWLSKLADGDLASEEISLFVRSFDQIERAKTAVERSGLAYAVLDEKMQSAEGKISVSTMHLAKGLEFRAVAVMACDDEVVPLQERIETVNDDADLEDVYNTERHLLYVACTRARDHLLVSGVEPASEFLDDLQLQ